MEYVRNSLSINFQLSSRSHPRIDLTKFWRLVPNGLDSNTRNWESYMFFCCFFWHFAQQLENPICCSDSSRIVCFTHNPKRPNLNVSTDECLWPNFGFTGPKITRFMITTARNLRLWQNMRRKISSYCLRSFLSGCHQVLNFTISWWFFKMRAEFKRS